jgi:hypothetical protein
MSAVPPQNLWVRFGERIVVSASRSGAWPCLQAPHRYDVFSTLECSVPGCRTPSLGPGSSSSISKSLSPRAVRVPPFDEPGPLQRRLRREPRRGEESWGGNKPSGPAAMRWCGPWVLPEGPLPEHYCPSGVAKSSNSGGGRVWQNATLFAFLRGAHIFLAFKQLIPKVKKKCLICLICLHCLILDCYHGA